MRNGLFAQRIKSYRSMLNLVLLRGVYPEQAWCQNHSGWDSNDKRLVLMILMHAKVKFGYEDHHGQSYKWQPRQNKLTTKSK